MSTSAVRSGWERRWQSGLLSMRLSACGSAPAMNFAGGRILATDRLGMDTSDTHQRGALKFDQATAAALRQRGRTAD